MTSIWNGMLFHRVINCILICSCCDAVAHSETYALSRRLDSMTLWRSLSNWTVLCLLLIVANITQKAPLAGISENLLSCLNVVAQSCSLGTNLLYRPLVRSTTNLKGNNLEISYCMGATVLFLWPELALKAVWSWYMQNAQSVILITCF